MSYLARRVRMKRFDWSRASPYFRLWTAICKHWRATFFPLRPASSRGPTNLAPTVNVSNIDFRQLMILNCYSLCQPRFYTWHAVYIDATEISSGNVTWENPLNRSKQISDVRKIRARSTYDGSHRTTKRTIYA